MRQRKRIVLKTMGNPRGVTIIFPVGQVGEEVHLTNVASGDVVASDDDLTPMTIVHPCTTPD